MSKPVAGWFGITFASFAEPEGHVVGLSKGAVQ